MISCAHEKENLVSLLPFVMSSDVVWIHRLARDNESHPSARYLDFALSGFRSLVGVVVCLVKSNSFWELVEAHSLYVGEYFLSTKERHGTPATIERARRVVVLVHLLEGRKMPDEKSIHQALLQSCGNN